MEEKTDAVTMDAENAKEENVNTAPEDAEKHTGEKCPCCGQYTLPAIPEIDQERADLWMACIISNEPYRDRYDLCGGNISATVTALTQDELDLMYRALSIIEDKAKRFIDPRHPVVAGRDMFSGAVRTLAQVARLELKHNNQYKVYCPKDVTLAVLKDIVSNVVKINEDEELSTKILEIYGAVQDPVQMSSVPAEIMVTVVAVHNRVNDILVKNAIDAPFWKGIKLA